jgi:hypothetical protein
VGERCLEPGVRVTYAANGHFDDGGVKANYYLSGNCANVP